MPNETTHFSDEIAAEIWPDGVEATLPDAEIDRRVTEAQHNHSPDLDHWLELRRKRIERNAIEFAKYDEENFTRAHATIEAAETRGLRAPEWCYAVIDSWKLELGAQNP